MFLQIRLPELFQNSGEHLQVLKCDPLVFEN